MLWTPTILMWKRLSLTLMITLIFLGFQLFFQTGGNLSKDEYAEYLPSIPQTETFTACLWFYIQYYSLSSNYIWQYCYQLQEGDIPVCTAFGRELLEYPNN